MELRPYQIDAVKSTFQGWESGYDSVLLVLATGLGKSVIATEIIRLANRPTLVLAHRHELINQLIQHTKGLPVTVKTIQSVARNIDSGIGVIDPDNYPLLVIDEAHHAVSPQYLKVIKHFPKARVLGITATPRRADRKALRKVFKHVAYTYETRQAIADGWLTPILPERARTLPAYLTLVGERKTIIFTPTVKAAKLTAERLLESDKRAMWIAGSMPQSTRQPILKAFAQGDLQFLVNCNLLTEGYDCPDIKCVTLLREVGSKLLFQQILGRGLRLADGKENCLLVNLSPKALCLKCQLKPTAAPLAGIMVPNPPEYKSSLPNPPVPAPPATARTMKIALRETRIQRVARWILRFLQT